MVKPSLSGVGRRSVAGSACITYEYYVQWLSSCPLSNVQCPVTSAVVSGLRSTCRGNVRRVILQLIPALSNSEEAERWAELDNALGVPTRLYLQAPEWEMTAGRNVIVFYMNYSRFCFLIWCKLLGTNIFVRQIAYIFAMQTYVVFLANLVVFGKYQWLLPSGETLPEDP